MTSRRLRGIQQWVALDLETTGLSAESDKIIEVGAVKFTSEGTLGELETLVNPMRPIPRFVRGLTGITQDEVDSAPPFSRVAPRLADFVTGSTIIAHNAGFDLGFLRESGLVFDRPVCDTWELAYLIRPFAKSYALDQLARNESCPVLGAHRALADARAVRDVFLSLISDLAELDRGLIEQIRLLAQRSGWAIGALLDSANEFRKPSIGAARARSVGGVDAADLSKRLAQPKAIRPRERRTPVNRDAVSEALSMGSPFSDGIPDFEERTEQIEMATAVADAINGGNRLIVEAGTGVGKSLAYLLPAALYSVANGKRIVVSTNTINLQEQLIHKDLPMLKEALRLIDPEAAEELRFTQLKGRANYICYKRWRQMRSSAELEPANARLLAKTLLWMPETDTGDRSELNLGHRGAAAAWERLSADRAFECPSPTGPCFLRAAREKAAASHIVVVNHALLLSDLAAGGTAIPSYDILIVDEAHQLEAEATRQLGFSISPGDLDEAIGELAGERGLLLQSSLLTERAAAGQSRSETVQVATSHAQATVPRLRESIAGLFVAVQQATPLELDRTSSFAQATRVTEEMRASDEWRPVGPAWEDAGVLLTELDRSVSSLVTALDGIDTDGAPEADSLLSDLVSVAQNLETLRNRAGEFLVSPVENSVYWVSQRSGAPDIALNGAPLHVGELLDDGLYSGKDAVVLTSATLATSGNFDHATGRLGITGADSLALGSPFDFNNAALLYTPRGVPAPNSAGFQERVETIVREAATAADGRTMVLFTSHAALRATSSAIRGPMSALGIDVLAQGVDGSPQQIATRFLEEPRSVLLGTSSFWGGVDFAGEALSVLIIPRLPFSVPTDPIFEARSEQYENQFLEFAVPEAIIRFRQGFGRLIRSDRDRGLAIILDSRVVNRRYGREFLSSLPKMRITDGKGFNVSDVVTRWLEYSG